MFDRFNTDYVPQTLDLPNYIVIFTPFELSVMMGLVIVGLRFNHILWGLIGSIFFMVGKRALISQTRQLVLTVRLYQLLPLRGFRLPPSYLRYFRGSHEF